MNYKLILLSLFSLFLNFASQAQSGSIKGKITDAKNSEAIIGGTVRVAGTALGSTTDIEGNFAINKVPAGVYTVQITYVSYRTKEIANVRVEADKTTLIESKIDEDTKTLQEVTVKAQRTTNTEVAVITEIKQIQQIAVGVSAQQIQKTQDRDASQVVRRIPGVSIFDDRFVVVRGLNERYNTVLLNDVITPSTEVDVKSFSFDLIPSAAIDRMLVYKSASADLPGDMGGGAIKIYTKTVPDGNNFSMGLSMGYRVGTTFEKANAYQGGKTDWLGFDDGSRSLPKGFPSRTTVVQNASNNAVIEKFRQLPNYYNVHNQSINPDVRANLSFSRRFNVGSVEVSNISYLNYSNTNLYAQIAQQRFEFDGTVEQEFRDKSLTNNVRLGAMSNWSFILNPKSKIEFRNLFNQIGIKETTLRNGTNQQNLELNNGAFRYEQRSIYSGQLTGTHELKEGLKLRWLSGLGYTVRNEPDYRRFTSSRAKGSNDPFRIDLQQFESPTLQQAARSYSHLDEYVLTGGANIEKTLGNKDQTDEQRAKIKAGVYAEYKDRYFVNRWFGITNPNRIKGDNSILTQTPEAFFSPQNLASSLVYYAEGTNQEDKYTAQNALMAGYVSAYWPITEKLNATVGFRGEFNQQKLQSRERGSGNKISVDNPVFSPLPSLNMTYNFTPKHAFRAAFSQTVNRPEFRELAPFTYYDFVFDVTRTGFIPRKDKARLENANITNFDVRYEFYPTKSELISVALFNKQFTNPIEAAIFYNGSTVAFTVDNARSAYTRGVEVEVRKNLSDKFMAVFNAAFIDSDVKAGLGDNSLNRSLQGQSPYLINTGIFYNNEATGWQINALYNVVGKRIYVIGDNQLSANIYEMPRQVIDLNMIKSFGKVELKLSIQDLLNQQFRLIQDTNRDGKITSTDGVFQSFRRGSNNTLGFTYRF